MFLHLFLMLSLHGLVGGLRIPLRKPSQNVALQMGGYTCNGDIFSDVAVKLCYSFSTIRGSSHCSRVLCLSGVALATFSESKTSIALRDVTRSTASADKQKKIPLRPAYTFQIIPSDTTRAARGPDRAQCDTWKKTCHTKHKQLSTCAQLWECRCFLQLAFAIRFELLRVIARCLVISSELADVLEYLVDVGT